MKLYNICSCKCSSWTPLPWILEHIGDFFIIKPNQMHQFVKFIPAWKFTCFGQFLCPSSAVYSLYTRH